MLAGLDAFSLKNILHLLVAPFGKDLVAFAVFNLFVLLMLALDLGLLQRKAGDPTLRQAAAWCVVWEVLGLCMVGVVYAQKGGEPALEFFTAYLVEKSLSVDNLFVFVLIFSYFKIPPRYQRRVLYMGIVGALLLRGIFILVGAALVARFQWLLYFFGAFLVYTGVRMGMEKEEEMDPAQNPILKLGSRFLPLSRDMHGDRFVVKIDGKRLFTPLFLVLLVVEFTDVVFALDSIPAVFGVSKDPYILYTSNVFAILGLRSLYFLLAGVADKFHYLQIGIAVVLVFVGLKMLVHHWVQVPIVVSLGVIVGVLALSVIASLMKNRKEGNSENPA